MTPEERAEKITPLGQAHHIDSPEGLAKHRAAIAAEIRAAVGEEYEKVAAKYADGNKRAIQATYEDAADIVEAMREEVMNGQATYADIAYAIRAAAKEIR